MTVDDAIDAISLGTALISPDGRHALFARTKPDWDENKRETEIHMVPTDGGEAWRYLGDDGGSAFAFSPDGRYLAFLRTAKKKEGGSSKSKAGNNDSMQLWWMRVAGGEAVQLTEHKTSVQSFKWAADSQTIFFKALDERPKDEDKDLKAGADAVFVNEGPNGQQLSYWSNLWSLDTSQEKSERKAVQLTEEKFILGDFDPSPDGKQVALTARYRNRRNDAYLTELFVLDVETKTKRRLTENRAPENSPLWSPKGDVFVYTAADDKEWLNRNTKIWLMDPVRAEHSLVSGQFEGSVSNVVWTPDGSSVLFTGQQGIHSDVYRMNVRSGEYERLTDGKGWLRSASFSADRETFVYSYSNASTPPELYAGHLSDRPEKAEATHGDGVGAVKLTNLNPQLGEVARGEMRVITWKSHDGLEIEGLLHLPLGYEEGKPYPLMLNIHGGPAGYFADMWRPHYHIYSGLGYASLSPNVRGSSGYTDALREGNTTGEGDGIGLGDYQDLMTGVDKLIADGLADPDRLALRGWSYGGILGGWTIGQTDRFKAASIGAGVYDWASEYGPGFNHDVRLWHIGGTPWDNPAGYRDQSAISFVKNVSTATLLLHGEEDTTCTEQQSMMMFVALQDIGMAPARYIKFPRQPHGIREPRHVRIRDIEEIRWMKQHVEGTEWTPWERKRKKKDDDEGSDSETDGDDETASSPAPSGGAGEAP